MMCNCRCHRCTHHTGKPLISYSLQVKRYTGKCIRSCHVLKAARMATEKNVQVFDSEEALSMSLDKYTADLSENCVKQKDSFTVVLSGESLIKSLRKLLEASYVDLIDWSKWHVLWADEQIVSKDHPNSNYMLAYDGFTSKVSANRWFLSSWF